MYNVFSFYLGHSSSQSLLCWDVISPFFSVLNQILDFFFDIRNEILTNHWRGVQRETPSYSCSPLESHLLWVLRLLVVSRSSTFLFPNVGVVLISWALEIKRLTRMMLLRVSLYAKNFSLHFGIAAMPHWSRHACCAKPPCSNHKIMFVFFCLVACGSSIPTSALMTRWLFCRHAHAYLNILRPCEGLIFIPIHHMDSHISLTL